jgi:geranylgeranyl pyrophosphate synthase
MEVLQKMFASTSKFSIPGIGIPLLSCGCADTSVDNEWFKEELYSLSENPAFRILNLNYLRNKTASIFGEEQLKRILEPSGDMTEQLLFESILAGGKRLRPLLTLLAYEAFCEQVDTTVLNRLALSIECFHKASLIHDDIEDEDELRYGKETLHARYGIPVAINIGDLLIGEGYRLIAETNLPATTIQECIKVVANGHRKLSVGQGIELMALKNREILSLQETLKVFEYKTSTAFKVSLLLGATAGCADQETLALLDEYSRAIGIAYQISDDLDDFSHPEGEFELLKPSVLVSMLYEKLPEADRILFQREQSGVQSDTLHQLIDQFEIRQNAETLLKSYLQDAKACLGTFQNIGLKMALHEILGNTFKAYL